MRKKLKALRRQKFVRDTFALQIASVITSGTYLVTSVLTARGLGRVELGRWATAREMYMALFFMVSFGLTNAAVSLYSQARGAQDAQRAIAALASLIKAGAIVSAILMGLGFFVMPDFAESQYGDREVGVVAGILCLAVVGEMLRAVTLAVLNGTRQMARYARFDVATNVLRVVVVAAALLISPTPFAVAWAFVTHGALVSLLAVQAYRSARRELGPSVAPPPLGQVLAAVPTAGLRSLLGISSMLALTKAMNVVVPRLGILFIPALAASTAEGFDANGAYQIGNVLTMVLTGAIGAIGTNVLPTLGVKLGQDGRPVHEQGPLMRKLSLTSGSFAIAATLLSVPFMWLVVRYAYGEAYMEAFDYYLLLATGNLFLGFAVIVEPFYIYARKLPVHVASSIVYSSLATGGIYLATRYGGPKGGAAAAGLCRIFVLFHLVYIWHYFRKHAQDRPADPALAPAESESSGRPTP